MSSAETKSAGRKKMKDCRPRDFQETRRRRFSFHPARVLAGCSVVLIAGAILFLSPSPAPPVSAPADAFQRTHDAQPPAPADRQRIEKLINEQKFEEAAKEAARLREEAKKRKDEPLWAWTLIKEVQLRIALHGYETAVRFLKEEAWPSDRIQQDMLELFYAQSLITYANAYSWEISRRERLESRGPVDLKAWTKDEIYAQAWNSLLRVWDDRQRLQDCRAADFPDFWRAGDYPSGIRDTLRDSVVYLIARLLMDTNFWTPRESNETYLLDLARLAGEPVSESEAESLLKSGSAHPLEKLFALLGEHEAWCLKVRRKEAALESRLARLQALHSAFTEEDERAHLRESLDKILPRYRVFSWWAMGQAVLADFIRAEDAPDALVRARQTAQEGYNAYPDSPGGKRCLHIVKNIEAPGYSVEIMKADAPGRRSIQVNHRNLDRLFFRAFPVDLMERIRQAKDYNLLPEWREALAIIEDRPPAASWEVELPATKDFRDHRSYVELPSSLAPGLYLVVASTRQDFARRRNSLQGVHVIVGDLLLLRRDRPDGGKEAVVLSGETGRPLANVEVSLYAYDWQKGHRRVETLTSDANGFVTLSSRPREGNFFLLAKRGKELALDSSYLYFYSRPKPSEATSILIFTDRSIYRPGQKIQWKILAYQGHRESGRIRPATNLAATVWLEDINGQRITEALRTTNDFGTASGEFVIPAAGRPLGAWRLRSLPDGFSEVRIEEYKRPTFEVRIKDPERPLRLNRPAVLTAEARYYFGLPVAGGTAVWQVKREPVYPRRWWRETVRTKSQIVAGGRSPLKEDGTFDMSFTPRADERKDKPGLGLTYRYTLSADVTDEGGETRSAVRSFRLGFVSVEARIEAAAGFFRENKESDFTITRTDLNGMPKAGRGTWRVVELIQPERTLLPADQPLPEMGREKDAAYSTPGDVMRPRWERGLAPESILALWKEGAEKAKGVVDHDPEGEARVAVVGLKPGPYRLIYETKDDFGTASRENYDFLVAGKNGGIRLPLVLGVEQESVAVGETAGLFLHSGWTGQPVLFEKFRGGELWERRWMDLEKDGGIIEIPVTEELRGGFGVRLTAVKDHQFMTEQSDIFVPWDNKELDLSFSSFRDRLTPGGREIWRITVKTPSGKPATQGAAELLAYMYDRSLDLFARHHPPHLLDLYPRRTGAPAWEPTLGVGPQAFREESGWRDVPSYPIFRPDALLALEGYGIGGPGGRGGVVGGVLGGLVREAPSPAASREKGGRDEAKAEAASVQAREGAEDKAAAAQEPIALRSRFDETAFWKPHLLTGPDGTAAVEFTVPDSVTAWRVFVLGITRDLMSGRLEKEARSVKELMVRPYLPRFFREGDRAELRVVVNNAGESSLSGSVSLEVFDPATGENLASAFGLPPEVPALPFAVEPGSGTPVVFPLAAPARVGVVAFKVTARAGSFSDGELRPLPILPGRMHLVQSRFAALKEGMRRELVFPDLAKTDDPTRIHEQLVVTVDAQLFYGLLEALPYLVNYPYECTEQMLNRFLSTGILTSLYDRYPQVARLAETLSRRETILETFDTADPNRKMSLEETPWLVMARGGQDAGHGVENVLDPRVAAAQKETSLAKLLKAQTSCGAFPWWPGGPPSPYMTLYIVHGFSKALEFGLELPKDPIVRAFGYLHEHYLDEIVRRLMAHDVGWEFVTFLNYTLANFPDSSWTGGVFTAEERKTMLDFSFRHWKEHSPYLKGYLTLTLKRAGRLEDAALVWESVMDSAKTTDDEGTFWAPEDRGWLWYNDAIETHAFALRTLMELKPDDTRAEGLVQWLFLNKKLNHWKSTRATSEVLYSVAHFLKKRGALGVRESVLVDACQSQTTFVFEPDKYTGKKNQVVIPGEKISPDCAKIVVRKEGPGMAFASATWHFSTERMPEKGEGDLFAVERKYFRRTKTGDEIVLQLLEEGAVLSVGDEIEVQLSIRARHPAEYVHLRDPRPSGCEPAALTSGYKWDLGIVRYEEIRDSGTNFFIEGLPQGEYTLKYRLRCALAGTFKAAPATLQSMYAPEFAAYSSGHILKIKGMD